MLRLADWVRAAQAGADAVTGAMQKSRSGAGFGTEATRVVSRGARLISDDSIVLLNEDPTLKIQQCCFMLFLCVCVCGRFAENLENPFYTMI